MINFLDLKKINQQYEEELKQAANEVIDSGWYLQGKQLDVFEKKIAAFVGTRYAVGVANGLDALRLILRAYIELGVLCEGDEVIVPANTYIASILAITENKLKPIFVEPDINNYNIDITKIEDKITERTKAIMIVHLYGRSCWSNLLEKIAVKYGLKIIEDNAQAVGGKWGERRTGALGDAAGISFYPGKNLGALGDSGAITTDDEKLAEIIRALGNYGSKRRYYCDYMGLNSRMDEIQAAFLNVKINHLDKENDVRKKIARYYIENIKNDKIILPQLPKSRDEHVWHLFVVRVFDRIDFQNYLTENKIQTLIHYPIPPHKQQAYSFWNHYNLPLTEKIHNEVLSLPISPILRNDEIEYIVEIINKF